MKKKKIELTPIEFPQINGFIHYFIESDIGKAKEYLDSKKNFPKEQLLGNGATLFMSDGNPIVWLRVKRPDIIVHEMIHAVMGLFDGIGIEKISKENDELFAYFVEYAVKEILKK